MGGEGVTALRDLWDDFCRAHAIAASGVPLFAADKAGVVETFGYGRNSRPMLGRSPAMRAKIIGTVNLFFLPHRASTRASSFLLLNILFQTAIGKIENVAIPITIAK